jgi:PAS domain S-box-containing protein
MSDASVSSVEARRLAALRALQILDTDAEEAFDHIAELATKIFNVPISQVSLVDEHREWFKACCGLPERQGDRQSAFCAHTILDNRVLVVEDTTADDRFRQNPSVTGSPGVRFYAGASLRVPSGLRIGAMCIKDYRPRSFSDAEALMLERLASLVMVEMEHRLVAGELLKWRRVFELVDWGIAVEGRDEKSFELMNPAFARLYGNTMEEMIHQPVADIFAQQVRHLVPEYIRATNEQGHNVFESLHVGKDGDVFPVRVNASAVKDVAGRVLFRAMHVENITERRRAEESLQKSHNLLHGVIENTSDVVFVKDVDGHYLMVNSAFVRFANRPLAEPI